MKDSLYLTISVMHKLRDGREGGLLHSVFCHVHKPKLCQILDGSNNSPQIKSRSWLKLFPQIYQHQNLKLLGSYSMTMKKINTNIPYMYWWSKFCWQTYSLKHVNSYEQLRRAKLVSLAPGPSFVAGVICCVNFPNGRLQGRDAPWIIHGGWHTTICFIHNVLELMKEFGFISYKMFRINWYCPLWLTS